MRTIRQTIEGMPLVFDREAAGSLEATIQFHVTGGESGDYVLDIGDGVCAFREGFVADPSLSITTPAEVWGRISRGEISGRDALLDGLYEVRGDAGLLTRLNVLFGRAPDEAVRAEPNRHRPGPIVLSGGRWLTVAFLPWFALWIGPVFGMTQGVVAWSACALAVGLVLYHSAHGGATWFEKGSAVVLCVGALASLTPGGRTLLATSGSLVDMAVLGLIWLSSIAWGRAPLTADYSRWDHASTLSGNSTFLHVNRVLTVLWGLVFTAMAMLSVAAARWPETAGVLGPARWLLLVPTVALTVTLPRRASRLRVADPHGWSRRLRGAAGVGLLFAAAAIVAAGSVGVARG